MRSIKGHRQQKETVAVGPKPKNQWILEPNKYALYKQWSYQKDPSGKRW